MSPLRLVHGRKSKFSAALCGGVATALLAAAPALAQVGVPGLKLPGAPTPVLNTLNLDAHSSCGAAPSTCTDTMLSVAATGTAALPMTTFTVKNARTIVNWSEFDLTGIDTVEFDFTARDDIIINLVNSPTLTASQINGVLMGVLVGPINVPGGNIWIINPAGVVFGANAEISTGGLLATTAQLVNQANFLAGGDTTPISFSGAPAGSAVQIAGSITGSGGTLAFIAPVVTTAATASISGAGPGACVVGGLCGTDVLYGAASAYTITFAPNANNDLDLFSFIIPTGGGSTSTTPMTLAGPTSAGNVYIAAVNEAAIVGAVVAPGAITATQAGGSNGDIVLSAGGGLQNTAGVVTPAAPTSGAGTTTAEFDSALSAGGGINLVGDSSIAVNSSAMASTGDVDITAAGPLTGGGTFSAPEGAIDITAASFDVGSVSGASGVSLTGTGPGVSDVITLATSPKGKVSIVTGGALDAPDALFTSLGGITIDTGGDFNAPGANFDTGGDLIITTGGAFTANGASLSTSGDMTITTGGAFFAPGASFETPANLTITTGGDFTATGDTLEPGGNLTINTTGSIIAPGVPFAPKGDLSIQASGDLSAAGAVFAGTDVTIDTGGTFTATGDTIAANGPSPSNVTIMTGGAFDASGATIDSLNGPVSVTAASFDIGNVTGFGSVTLTATGPADSTIEQFATSTTGDLDITTAGTLQAADATLLASAGSITVTAASFNLGTVNGFDTVDITGTGPGESAIGVSATSQTGDLSVIAAGPLNAANASLTAVNGNVVASAGPNGTADPAYFLDIGGANAGGTLILQGGALTLGLSGEAGPAAEAGSGVYVRTADLSLLSFLLSGANIVIASTAGNLNLGDNVFGAPGGLNISNATFNLLIAPIGAISLYAGDPGNAALSEAGVARGNLTVGTLAIGDNATALNLFADSGHTVTFTGPVTASFGETLTVGGTPPPSDALTTTDWTPGQVLIEAQSVTSGGPDGSIGTAASPFFSVTLNAVNDVIMGTPGFITAISATPGAQINLEAGSPPIPAGATPVNGEILLASDLVTLQANGKIVQQNTSSGGGFSGLIVDTSKASPVALLLGCVSCAAASPPSVIDLFGTIGDGVGGMVTGQAVAMSPEIELEAPLAINPQFRANGCIIKLPGACAPIITVPIIPISSELPPTNTIEALLTLTPEPPLLDVGDYEGQADVTIIGSGSEEIWRKPEPKK